ncbi:unnamed protein product, partial [Callosobruchus maculatus]
MPALQKCPLTRNDCIHPGYTEILQRHSINSLLDQTEILSEPE